MFALIEGDAQASDDVVEGTVLISDTHVRCLFDSGSTHLFIALHFAQKLHVATSFMETGLLVSTLVETLLIQMWCIRVV